MEVCDLVTVCITTFNRYSVIKTIKSVQRQTYENIEIILVDDCSTNIPIDELHILAKYDSRIKIIRHNQNKGLAAARNTAIKKAKGKFFTFIDDDDLWESDYIYSFIKLARNYNSNWCFCCGPKVVRKNNTYCFIPTFSDSLENIIYQGYTPPISGQFYHLSSLIKVKGYNESLKSGIDHDIWLKLAVEGIKIKSNNKCLVFPNKDIYMNRITTDSTKRITNIRDSLKIWKPLIMSNFKTGFYEHFKTCYEYFNYKSFFFHSLKKSDFKMAVYYLRNCPRKYNLIIEVLKKTADKIFLNRRVIRKSRPLFIPFKGNS